MENVFKKVCSDLQAAMKAGDKDRLETLRMMKSQVLLVNARGDLPDAEVTKILAKYAKSLKQSIEEFNKVNRPDAAKKVEAEVKVVEEYLPKPLSEKEVAEIAKKVISEVGAGSPKQMGLVMKKIMSENAGVDGSIVKKVVSGLLAQGEKKE